MACKLGHVSIMKLLLEDKHANLYAMSEALGAPIHAAVESGSIDAVQYLIDYAGTHQQEQEQKQQQQQLDKQTIKAKFVNTPNEASEARETALAVALNNKNLVMFEFLIAQGANVNATIYNETILQVAKEPERNTEEFVQVLLKHGAI